MKRESDKIVSIAVLKAKAGMRERLRHELLALIAPTRREPGLPFLFDLLPAYSPDPGERQPCASSCYSLTPFSDSRARPSPAFATRRPTRRGRQR